jgi:hypothetical protein
VTVTNPKGWTTTTYDQERGLATRVSDVNQQVTTEVTESDAAYWDSTASAYTARTGLPLSTGYGNDAGLISQRQPRPRIHSRRLRARQPAGRAMPQMTSRRRSSQALTWSALGGGSRRRPLRCRRAATSPRNGPRQRRRSRTATHFRITVAPPLAPITANSLVRVKKTDDPLPNGSGSQKTREIALTCRNYLTPW